LPWKRKFENFHTKFTITQLGFKLGRRILHQTGGFGVGQSNGVVQIFARSTLIAMVTKIVKFQQKITYKSACIGGIIKILILGPNGGFSGSANLTVQVKFVSDQPLLPW